MNKQNDDYDLVVIGAGPGGYVAAIRAAQLGMRVACVEKDATLGGTCLNVGCIPSKALLDSSERYRAVRTEIAGHGIRVGEVELDLAGMMGRKDKVVRQLTQGIASLFKKNKVDHIAAHGELVSAGVVRLSAGDGPKEIRGRHLLMATGSVPVELRDLPFDGKHVISSTEALRLPRVPERLLVIGAGAVGLELGSVWSRLGARVVVVEFLDRIVPGMDRKMGRQLQRALRKQGLEFRLNTRAKEAKRVKKELRVSLESDGKADEESCDVMLVAVGRRPFTDGLGLEKLGVVLDDDGRIRVDDDYRTNVEGIYAIGDVIPGPMLAHKAEEEGIAAVEKIAGLAGHVNYDTIPNVVYTAPELACVGLSEEQVESRGVEFEVGSFPFMANGRAKCMGETEGSVKILAERASDRVLGVHILGAHASDLIAEAAVAMEFGASAEDIARSVHAHPTLPEAVKEAALAVRKRALHI
jgi:dihydrolipoamide dehydrogenase